MEDKIKQLESENARLRDALKKITEHCEAVLRVTDEIKDLLEKDKTAADDGIAKAPGAACFLFWALRL